MTAADNLRSYFVDTPSRTIRRKHQHLEPFLEANNSTVPTVAVVMSQLENGEQLPPNNPEPSEYNNRVQTQSQIGDTVVPLKRYMPFLGGDVAVGVWTEP